jgi:hypothetical protein
MQQILSLEEELFALQQDHSPDNAQKQNNVYFKITDTAIRYQNWEIAQKALGSVNEDFLADSIMGAYYYKRAYVSATQGNFQNAFILLSRIEKKNYTAEHLACVSACMILDTAYLFQHALALNPLINNSDLKIWRQTYPSQKNETLAKWFSVVIPGVGSIYAGNTKHGITALLGCTAIAIGSVYLIKNNYYIIPAVAGLGLFTRFYMGSIKNAHLDIEHFNENALRKWKASVCNALLVLPISSSLQ